MVLALNVYRPSGVLGRVFWTQPDCVHLTVSEAEGSSVNEWWGPDKSKDARVVSPVILSGRGI